MNAMFPDSTVPFGFTFGASHTQSHWSDFRRVTWPQLVEMLTSHVPGQKEGSCIVPAQFSGSRRHKDDAARIDVAFLDSDAGITMGEIEAAIVRRGWEAVISSTHSHMTTRTKVRVSNWDRFFNINPDADAERFLIDDKGYLPSVARGAEAAETTGDYVYIDHQPCPKFRVVIPLERPWLASDYASQVAANAAWKERIEALAYALSLPHDQSCTDTSRLFYLPRRPAGGVAPETVVVEGAHCDVFALPVPAASAPDLLTPRPGGAQRAAAAERHEHIDPISGEVLDLAAWAKEFGGRFLIAKALHARKPGAFTGTTRDGKAHIDCPNADAHTQAGRDEACYVVNGGNGQTKGFVIHCRHAHCTGRDRLAFLAQMLDAGWLAADDLRDARFLEQDAKPKKDRPKREQHPATGLPLIQLTAGELHTSTTAGEDAIIAAGVPLYQRGIDLVRPASREVPATHGRTTTTAGLAVVNVHALVDVLCSVAEFTRFDMRADAWVRVNPPKQVADILLSRQGQWRVPHVAGVVTTPTMRADGSILSAPGYDPATRLYHVADPSLTLHPAVAKPTKKDAAAALKALESLLTDFPFTKMQQPGQPDQEVSKAVALSALVTPLIRGAIPVAPAHAFRANAPGSGKSYLVDLSSAIATGRPCPVMSVAPGDETETEKRLAGLLLGGYPIISLDNANCEIGGDLLCQAIERPLVGIRRFGRLDIVEIESRSTVFVTGNQLRVRGDMVRRTLVSDLDAGMERPEERAFAGDPVAAVLADRGRYVSAGLVIVRAYMLAGCPDALPPIASFGEWSRLVRSALVWLGCADPVLSMKAARDDDPELGDLREVMGAWRDAFGSDPTTCRAAIDAAGQKSAKADEDGDVSAYAPAMELRHPALNDALARVAGFRGVIDPTRLGRWLLSREGRIIGGERFKRDGTTDGAVRWKLGRVTAEGGEGG